MDGVDDDAVLPLELDPHNPEVEVCACRVVEIVHNLGVKLENLWGEKAKINSVGADYS